MFHMDTDGDADINDHVPFSSAAPLPRPMTISVSPPPPPRVVATLSESDTESDGDDDEPSFDGSVMARTTSIRVSHMQSNVSEEEDLESALLNANIAAASGSIGRPSLPLSSLSISSAPPIHTGVSVGDFELLKVVGRGAYGKVFLVRRKANGRLYAMKVVRKCEAIRKNVVENMRAERDVLEAVRHPFIVNLRFAFQSETKLYLVLDFISGGELFTRLNNSKDNALPIKDCRFYAAEIVLAIEHLHKLNIIYRDLKPENLMLDRFGHIVMCDFGFAKEHVSSSDTGSRSFCGTIQYMSPELIQGIGHGKGSDWWALGIVLYEMLTGSTPFKGANRKALQDSILTAPLKLPKYFDSPTKSIITELLRRPIHKRLGCGPNGAADLKKHPFFMGIDWIALSKKMVQPPYVPSSTLVDGNEDDTKHFDTKFTSERVIDTPLTPSMMAKIMTEHGITDQAFQAANQTFALFGYEREHDTPAQSPLIRPTNAISYPLHAHSHSHSHHPHHSHHQSHRPSVPTIAESNVESTPKHASGTLKLDTLELAAKSDAANGNDNGNGSDKKTIMQDALDLPSVPSIPPITILSSLANSAQFSSNRPTPITSFAPSHRFNHAASSPISTSQHSPSASASPPSSNSNVLSSDHLPTHPTITKFSISPSGLSTQLARHAPTQSNNHKANHFTHPEGDAQPPASINPNLSSRSSSTVPPSTSSSLASSSSSSALLSRPLKGLSASAAVFVPKSLNSTPTTTHSRQQPQPQAATQTHAYLKSTGTSSFNPHQSNQLNGHHHHHPRPHESTNSHRSRQSSNHSNQQPPHRFEAHQSEYSSSSRISSNSISNPFLSQSSSSSFSVSQLVSPSTLPPSSTRVAIPASSISYSASSSSSSSSSNSLGPPRWGINQTKH